MSDSTSFSLSASERMQKFVEFGEDALAADDLEGLLYTAIRNVAEGLDAEHAKVLVPQEDGSLLVTAGIGWAEGVVGNAKIQGDVGSPPGFAIKTGRPIRSGNLDTESRFEAPQLLRDHGIKSAINVIIRGDGAPFGVLEVDSTEPRDFTPNDTAFMQGYAQLLSAAISRVKQTERLQEISSRNAFLLNELHHRIGNDFQLVISLINIRSKQCHDDAAKAELEWVSVRIRSLVHLHAQLRATNSSDFVDLSTYLDTLGRELASTHEFASRAIHFDVQTQRWEVPAREAISIGLILNEFVTNSVEHAFSQTGGTISVRLEVDQGAAVLRLSDTGNGFDMAGQAKRSGLGLMKALAESVSTEVKRDATGGMSMEMRLKPSAALQHQR